MSVLKGRLKIWDEEQGYGVISTADDLGDVRFELADLMGLQRPLTPGIPLAFTLKAGKGGVLHACRVQPVGVVLGSLNTHRLNLKHSLLIASPLLLSLLVLPASVIPLLLYIVFSVIAGVIISKAHTQKSPHAIQRNSLLAVELCGGWPGSYLAQALLDYTHPDAHYYPLSKMIPTTHLIMWTLGIVTFFIL